MFCVMFGWQNRDTTGRVEVNKQTCQYSSHFPILSTKLLPPATPQPSSNSMAEVSRKGKLTTCLLLWQHSSVRNSS